MNPRRSLFWVRRWYLIGEWKLEVVVGAVDAYYLPKNRQGHVQALSDQMLGRHLVDSYHDATLLHVRNLNEKL
jgi:hypothetical protein